MILVVATQGSGGTEEARIRALLGGFAVEFFPVDRRHKAASSRRLLSRIRSREFELVVLEGTGLAGGLACLLGRALAGVPYVVSSGDATGPWVASMHAALGPLFALYERALVGRAAGFIGWTPYLVGRALTFGVPRAMTAAGWAATEPTPDERASARARIRSELGIPPEALVVGIAGSLAWSPRRRYCYGLELVRALEGVRRPDVRVLVVGDGTGRAHLERAAGAELGERVLLTGRVPHERVLEYLAAMDIGCLPQSTDGVGSFRYSTKLPEYVAAGLPVVTNQIPLAYDLDAGWLWRLPGDSPWDTRFVEALASLLETVEPTALEARRRAVPVRPREFDRASQVSRATAFVREILEARGVR